MSSAYPQNPKSGGPCNFFTLQLPSNVRYQKLPYHRLRKHPQDDEVDVGHHSHRRRDLLGLYLRNCLQSVVSASLFPSSPRSSQLFNTLDFTLLILFAVAKPVPLPSSRHCSGSRFVPPSFVTTVLV